MDVAAYFNDPDGDSLTFAATSSDTAVVRAAATGSQVDLTGGSVGGEGTVTASDPAGLAATASFAVAVNRPPVASEEIPTQSLLIEGPPVDVDVSGFFSDPDGDSLTFAATSSDAAVVAASTAEAVVRLEARAAGEATVTVTASDPEGLETQTAFNSYSTDHPPYPIHVTYSSEREPYDGFYAAVDRAIVRWGRVLAPTVPAYRRCQPSVSVCEVGAYGAARARRHPASRTERLHDHAGRPRARGCVGIKVLLRRRAGTTRRRRLEPVRKLVGKLDSRWRTASADRGGRATRDRPHSRRRAVGPVVRPHRNGTHRADHGL